MPAWLVLLIWTYCALGCFVALAFVDWRDKVWFVSWLPVSAGNRVVAAALVFLVSMVTWPLVAFLWWRHGGAQGRGRS